MQYNISLLSKWWGLISNSNNTLLNPNISGLEGVIPQFIENKDAVNFNIIEDGRIDIEYKIPSIGNCNILSSSRQNSIRPLRRLAPQTTKCFTFCCRSCWRAEINTSDTIQIYPLSDCLITTTHTNVQILVILVVVVICILTGCWIDQCCFWGYEWKLQLLLIPFANLE